MSEKWWTHRFVNRRDFLLDRFESLALTAQEGMILLLIDFMNEHRLIISHAVLAAKLKIDDQEVDELLSTLVNKGYLQILYQQGTIEFSIDGIFEEQKKPSATISESLFDMFESVFARPLSSVEMQRIAEWMQTYEQAMIEYALREADLYNTRSLDYIDRILAEWKRRGLNAQQLERGER